MEVDAAKKANAVESKTQQKKNTGRWCSWCENNGHKRLAHSHTEDYCRQKPKPSTSSAPKPPAQQSQQHQGRKPSFSNQAKPSFGNQGRRYSARVTEIEQEMEKLRKDLQDMKLEEERDLAEVDAISLENDSLDDYLPLSLKGKEPAYSRTVRFIEDQLSPSWQNDNLPTATITEVPEEPQPVVKLPSGPRTDDRGGLNVDSLSRSQEGDWFKKRMRNRYTGQEYPDFL